MSEQEQHAEQARIQRNIDYWQQLCRSVVRQASLNRPNWLLWETAYRGRYYWQARLDALQPEASHGDMYD